MSGHRSGTRLAEDPEEQEEQLEITPSKWTPEEPAAPSSTKSVSTSPHGTKGRPDRVERKPIWPSRPRI